MNQCVFDEFIHFTLQTISSEEYLNSIGILRPPTITLDLLKEKVKDQTLYVGVYAVYYGDDVHYFGARRKKDKIIVGNGYPTKEGLSDKYSVALNAQPWHSHGLCQTFALMFYLGQEKKLKTGKYFDNVKIGLKFLLDYIEKSEVRERIWGIRSCMKNMQKLCDGSHNEERKKAIELVRSSKYCNRPVALSLIIRNILLNREYKDNLYAWFNEDLD